MVKKQNSVHVTKQEMIDSCPIIDCPEYDEYKDFKMELTGCYVLIRVNLKDHRIELAVCNKKHQIIAVFQGKKSQDIYHTLFKYEKEENFGWFQSKDHMAYLGKELKKAELALESGSLDYYQE